MMNDALKKIHILKRNKKKPTNTPYTVRHVRDNARRGVFYQKIIGRRGGSSPIISDNGHLEGHYLAYTMIPYEINKYEIKY